MGQQPTSAKAVIIGGGIVGCSTAYHLAKLGWTDTGLVERGQPEPGRRTRLQTGTTSVDVDFASLAEQL